MNLDHVSTKYITFIPSLRWVLMIVATSVAFLVYPVSQSIDNVANDELYGQLNRIDSEQLMREAEENILNDTLLARATMALSIVANRYYENPKDRSARKIAIKAFRELGNFYYEEAVDLKNAYKYLATAQQIAEEDNDQKELAFIYQSLSTLFHNSDVNDKLSSKVKDYMIKGLDAAMASGNWSAMALISLGMTSSAFNEGSWGDFEGSIKEFEAYPKNEKFKYHGFIQLAIDACNSFLSGNYDRAEKLLIESKSLLKSNQPQIEIFKLTVEGWLVVLANKKGDQDKAITLSRNMLAHIDSLQLPIYKLDVYHSLKKLYADSNHADSADYYYDKFLRMKDGLENSIGYGNVEKLDFLSEIDKINNDVEKMSLRRQEERRQRIIVTAILIVVLVVLIALFWGYLNLRRHHRNLFKRNEEMMRMAAQHKLLREQWEDEKKTDKEDDEEDKEISDKEDLKRIYARVLTVMEGSKEIFEPGFSLHDLSKIVKVSVRNVSKAINTCHDTNFPQLLNEFRIREVMRIMHSGEAENLTIEGIAEQAGFRSRTSFSNLFKKTTGLTPAEYRKMASAQT